MSFAEFWALTPADVSLALTAYETRERAAYWRAGLITSAVIKAAGGNAKPDDFVPQQRRVAQTPAQMATTLRSMTLALGGSVSG